MGLEEPKAETPRQQEEEKKEESKENGLWSKFKNFLKEEFSPEKKERRPRTPRISPVQLKIRYYQLGEMQKIWEQAQLDLDLL